MPFENLQKRNSPRNSRTTIQDKLTVQYITDERSYIGHHLVNLEHKPAGKRVGPHSRYETRWNVGLPELVASIRQETLTSTVLEAGMVSIFDDELEVERDVQLNVDDRERDARRDPLNCCGEEFSFGLLGFEYGQCQDEDYDEYQQNGDKKRTADCQTPAFSCFLPLFCPEDLFVFFFDHCSDSVIRIVRLLDI